MGGGDGMGDRLYEIAVEEIADNKIVVRIKGSVWSQVIDTDVKDEEVTIVLGRKGLRGVAREE
jgi:membrane protein implicated in regulation of membrane protease activity